MSSFQSRPQSRPQTPRTRPLRVIAIASGKGGVGKTQVAVNLAVELSRLGERVLVIDGDLGTCNAHLLLDVAPPAGLGDVACGLIAIEDALVVTPYGPTLLAGRAHGPAADGFDDCQQLTLLAALDSIGHLFDVVVIDTAPGVGRNALFFAGAAEEVLLVTTPEPTALADTYVSARALLRRGSRSHIGLVVNQATSLTVAHAVHHRLRSLVRQFLGAEVELFGWLPFDPLVHDAVMHQAPFVATLPGAPASRRVRALAQQLQDLPAGFEGSADLRFFWSTLHGATR